MGIGGSVAMTKGVIVDVVVVAVCGARGALALAAVLAALEVAVLAALEAALAASEVAVVVDARDTRGEMRIHARTPRFRPRAPSTPTEDVIAGVFAFASTGGGRVRRLSTP